MSILSNNVLFLLGQQYAHEHKNSLLYYQRASFLEFRGMTHAATFFLIQAQGERDHADKILQYVTERSLILPISGIPLEDTEFNLDIDSVFTTSLAIEKTTTAMLENILASARDERDYMTEQWLLDPAGLIKEQVEEENIYQTILDRMGILGDSASRFHDLDLFIKETYL